MTTEKDYVNYRIDIPPAFETVFSHFYYAKNNTSQSITKTLFPSYQTIFVFNFGPKVALTSQNNNTIVVNKCIALGPIKQAFDYTLPAGSEILVANFKDDAFFRFFGTVQLSNDLPLKSGDKSLENCFTDLWKVLKNIDPVSDKVSLILDFCQPYLQPRDKSVELLVNTDDNNEALNKIKVIAGNTNQSERTVQLNHKKYLGYSAKEMNRYQRFLKAIELIQRIVPHAGKMDWFEIIHHCGYYDQSQLIHDFKHYIKLTPKQYLKFQQDICFANPS